MSIFHFHRWSKWEDDGFFYINPHSGILQQKRICIRCGLVQYRRPLMDIEKEKK
jgi:hypothetical protein